MNDGDRPRVALIVSGDPGSPQTWSGIPRGVSLALRELAVAVLALDVTLAPGAEQALLALGAVLTRNRYDAESAALTMRVRSSIARRRLRDVHIDGAIQIGTTFSLPADVGYVTLEDMTLAQARTVHPVFSRMSGAALARWEQYRAELYGRARMCAVASHWAADSLGSDYGVPCERVAVVGFGANHPPAAHAPERDWQTPRFLFVGIDWERKGGPLVLPAFSRLRQTHPDATLDVVGGHPRLGEPGVRGHGELSPAHVEERDLLARLYARATCLVMPSLVEPFGIVHIEAGLAGIPSIGTSVGGPRDVIGDDGG
ncbi:MAG: glycosyltransferase family 4 protein, partial [Solirubrobacteraceae bacterium]